MRSLVLTRGSMGSGKSTFLKNKNLEQYALCPDQIRLMYQTPVLLENGKYGISQKNDKAVWKTLFDLLEARMERGEFTIVDACHTKTSDMKKYKELAQKYRYRVYVLDFTDVTMEQAMAGNLARPEYKHVPENAIITAYARFKTQEVPSFVTVVKPWEFDRYFQFTPLNFDNWKKIHVIGDLHGCNTTLQEYLNGDLKDDELYIFLGDYVDRGIENAELLNFLFTIYDRSNVIMLEGNHERWIWAWANNQPDNIRSKEFKFVTLPQLEHAGVSKKTARMFYRKLRQCAYFTYGVETVLCTHGGLSTLPDNLTFLATEQMIKGVGDYSTPIDKHWFDNTLDFNIVQIHGHRNIQKAETHASLTSFNLENAVEMGGHLRVVTMTMDKAYTVHEIKNNVVSDRFTKRENLPVEVSSENTSFLQTLRDSKLVYEKPFGNISAFNFRNAVFFDKAWDETTIKARGLFINTETEEIVARSYNKFFNINEREETKLDALSANLVFPVNIYLKENGYLGILGYDSQTDELLFCSKSTLDGDYALNFKNIFKEQVDLITEDNIKEYLKDKNVSIVFEVKDPEFDPHIIQYNKKEIVLLDVVKREPKYFKLDYDSLTHVAEMFDLKCKQKIHTFKDWQDFYTWYNYVTNNMKLEVEGYVIEDKVDFMTKIKIPYYNFWKHMRSVKDALGSKSGHYKYTSSLTTPLANEVYGWLKSKTKEELKADIITLRNQFYAERGN